MEISTYLNQKNLKRAQEKDDEKKQQDQRIQNLMKIKEDITKQGVPNYNAQTSKDAFKFHKNPVNKVPIKRTAMRKEVVGDFDTHEIDEKMQQIEEALTLFENTKEEKQHNIGYLPNLGVTQKAAPSSTLVDQRLSLLKRDFYLAMDQVAVNVNKQLKTKKKANIPTDKYLKRKTTQPDNIINTTDQVLRLISRNLAGIKKSEQKAKKVEEEKVEKVVQDFLQKSELIEYTRTPEESAIKQKQWYAAVNLNHANAAIIRANLSRNPNIKQLLIYNYEDAIRWDPPKYVRSQNNRIPQFVASKYAEDKIFAEIKEVSNFVDDEIEQQVKTIRGSQRYPRSELIRPGHGPEPPPAMKISKKMKLQNTKLFVGLRADTTIGQRRGTMKHPPVATTRVVFEIEVKNLPETASGIIYPASFTAISRAHSENLSAYSRNSQFYGYQHTSGGFMELHPTDMGTISEETHHRREEMGDELERSQIFEQGAEEEARLADLMQIKRSFFSSGHANKQGREIAKRKEQEREQIRSVTAEQELRAVNQEDFEQFIEYFHPITEKPAAMIVEDESSPVQNAKQTKKQRQAAMKAATGKRAVAAYEKGSDDFGQINFYGIVHKRRGKTMKFHPRWMVLRGIDLFWYRSASAHEQKGVVRLPSIELQYFKVGRVPCFSIMESGDRELTFRDNEHGHHFRVALANAIGMKLFMEERLGEVAEECEEPQAKSEQEEQYQREFDAQTIAYFRNSEIESVEFKNKPMLLKYYALIVKSLAHHQKLLSLTLSGCNLQNDHLMVLAQVLTTSKNQLARLDISLNNLTARSVNHIFSMFKSQHCAGLRILILDDNHLQDSGVQRLASALYDRFEILNTGLRGRAQLKPQSFDSVGPSAELTFPLDFLSLAGVGMGDQGLASLVSRLDQIRLKALAQTGSSDAFEGGFGMEISRNTVSDSGLRLVGELLKELHCLSFLKGEGLRMSKGVGFTDIASALNQNHSLLSLDISSNELRTVAIKALFQSLQVSLSTIQNNDVITQLQLPLTRSLMNMLRSRHTEALTKSFVLHIDRGTPNTSKMLKRDSTLQNYSDAAFRRLPTIGRESSRVHFQDTA